MICRLWHGWTKARDADAYQSYLRDELYPRLDRELAEHGYRGHHVLRRAVGDEVEFVTMTWFDSLASIRGFAGDDYETPVISDTAARLLDHYDPKAAHFDLAVHAERYVTQSRQKSSLSAAARSAQALPITWPNSDWSTSPRRDVRDRAAGNRGREPRRGRAAGTAAGRAGAGLRGE